MKRLVEFPLKEGGSIIVEVDEPESEGTVRAGRGDAIVKMKETLEDVLCQILPAANSVAERLRNIGNKPDGIEIRFGVKLGTQAGAIIASASADANFDVSVRWTEKKEGTGLHP